MLSFAAGGEYVCMNVCQALQEIGFRVSLASEPFRLSELNRVYGMEGVMENCERVVIPQFKQRMQRLLVLQRFAYARRVWPMFKNFDPDIVFSTQSSPFVISRPTLHFVYDAKDKFSYPRAAAPDDRKYLGTGPIKAYFDTTRWLRKLVWKKIAGSNDPRFLAVGSLVLDDLKRNGYRNSSLIFPPCRIDFEPRLPKKKQVAQASRIIPEKRLELFIEIALRLPEYKFYLVGRRDQISEGLYPGYAQSVLSALPRNVTYLDALVREHKEILEESKVYVYTGREPGIGIALMEAIAAGCIPFCPSNAGAADVVRACGVGHFYNTAEEAVMKIKLCLEQDIDHYEVLKISAKVKMFSPEAFRSRIQALAKEVLTKNEIMRQNPLTPG